MERQKPKKITQTSKDKSSKNDPIFALTSLTAARERGPAPRVSSTIVWMEYGPTQGTCAFGEGIYYGRITTHGPGT